MRDILDDYIESKIRIAEAGVSVVVTGLAMKLIDVAGMAGQITSSFDWFAVITALLALSYFSAGSIHDWYGRKKDGRYVTVRSNREDAA